ncbi:hypothetical protein SS50377_24002 [Spironucleus salmonicida]|uniref:Uncharacterized protein n=1 Tax=Spironucleus salmonicida TaxID=348837 RepID=V6LEJ0_9EUKA|nr:hypothetical protein SS50377_24002 [Spironucleus salmonicida]|eukprot:EST42902.1 Hypothetical protein SS50377_17436 [Spironucleus salmonicida]
MFVQKLLNENIELFSAQSYDFPSERVKLSNLSKVKKIDIKQTHSDDLFTMLKKEKIPFKQLE